MTYEMRAFLEWAKSIGLILFRAGIVVLVPIFVAAVVYPVYIGTNFVNIAGTAVLLHMVLDDITKPWLSN